MQSPIRILQIIGKVCGGGVEMVVMNYYRHVDRNKIQFDFIIEGHGKSLLDDEIATLGGIVYKVEPYKLNIIKYLYQIYRIIWENKYQIVHSHMGTMAVFSLLAAWYAGAKIRIVHNHTVTDKSEGLRYCLKILLRPFATLFATNMCACASSTAEWMYRTTDKVKIIHNAIDLNKWQCNNEIRICKRKEWGMKDSFVIGHVGRFEQAKNHLFLLKIFKDICAQKKNAKLLLIGDGSWRCKIFKEITRLGIKNDVVLMGLRDDVNEIVNAFDVFLLPSFFEGFPVVAIEAQAVGIPMVISDKVTREIAVANNVELFSLEKTSKQWASESIKVAAERNAGNRKKLQDAGYDINLEAPKLAMWYEKLNRNAEIQ